MLLHLDTSRKTYGDTLPVHATRKAFFEVSENERPFILELVEQNHSKHRLEAKNLCSKLKTLCSKLTSHMSQSRIG